MSALGQIRNEFGAWADEYHSQHSEELVPHGPSARSLSPGARGALIGALNRELGGDMNRKQFLKALTGYSSSKDLNDAEWYALAKIAGLGAGWQLEPGAVRAMKAAIADAMQNSAQLSMFDKEPG